MIVELVARALEAPLVIGSRGAPAATSAEPADAIVVLGAPLAADGGLSAVLAERVRAGIELWRAGAAPRLVMSGGRTRGAARAEAEVMAEAARAGGVPDDALVVEAVSLTTAANAREVACLVPRGARIWVVTQPFHGRRARRLFRRAGLDAQVWHLADSLEYRDRRRALGWLAREYAAWARLLVASR
jgi:uncharacterized SAM-binding protein YcdF (DUF218 family)